MRLPEEQNGVDETHIDLTVRCISRNHKQLEMYKYFDHGWNLKGGGAGCHCQYDWGGDSEIPRLYTSW